MARRETLFGLPRYVLAILRHMEAHSERLKWSLAEESNQLTLTLTWNFDSAKPRKTKETLWKKLQRSLGFERHQTLPSPSSHSSPDLQQAPTQLTRRFLLETSSPLAPANERSAPVSMSRSTADGWRSRESQLTMTSRCRSLPGRMHESSGQSATDGWERSSMTYRQSRARRSETSSAQPPRVRRGHQQGQVYSRHTSSPAFVTPSSHLTLPAQRSRGPAVTSSKSYVTSHPGGGAASRGATSRSQRHVSPSHFSWPGASFEVGAGGATADDDEGRSSAGTQGAAEPTSPSLPSSTSTATNACTRPIPGLQLPHVDVATTNDDVTPSNGDVDTEVADVTSGGGATETGEAAMAKSDDNEVGQRRRRRRRSCEFNVLDDDDFWPPDTEEQPPQVASEEWAWATRSERSDWTDVMCVNDDDIVQTPTTTTSTAAAAATGDSDVDDVDDDDDDDVTQSAINETVMKCIESCDKVLLRHSTAIR